MQIDSGDPKFGLKFIIKKFENSIKSNSFYEDLFKYIQNFII